MANKYLNIPIATDLSDLSGLLPYEWVIGVYKIRNKVNNRIYIGSSDNLRRRLDDHYHTLLRSVHTCSYLQRSFNKHGQGRFEFWIVEVCNEEKDLLIREQYYLDKWLFAQEFILSSGTDPRFRKLGYNTVPLADRTLGYKHTKEDKEFLSALSISLWQDEEWRARSLAARKVNGNTEYNKQISKAILLYSAETGNFFAEYPSLSAAARGLNVTNTATLSNALRGNCSTAYGYLVRPWQSDYSKITLPIDGYKHKSYKTDAIRKSCKSRRRKVVVKDLNGIIVRIFGSVQEACDFYNIKKQSILRSIKLKRPTTGKFIFEYMN